MHVQQLTDEGLEVWHVRHDRRKEHNNRLVVEMFQECVVIRIILWPQSADSCELLKWHVSNRKGDSASSEQPTIPWDSVGESNNILNESAI